MIGLRRSAAGSPEPGMSSSEIEIPPLGLGGTLKLPQHPAGLIVFVHGSGSSRFSARNNAVADVLNKAGFATLLFDLLRPEEEGDRSKIFDIGLLTERLIDAIRWIDASAELSRLPLGLFGASTGAAAALCGAARLNKRISAIVSRGGRPDLAGAALAQAEAATLLIVGSNDDLVIHLNEKALAKLKTPKALWIVPNATHLFPEPGALEMVSRFAVEWFSLHLAGVEAGS